MKYIAFATALVLLPGSASAAVIFSGSQSTATTRLELPGGSNDDFQQNSNATAGSYAVSSTQGFAEGDDNANSSSAVEVVEQTAGSGRIQFRQSISSTGRSVAAFGTFQKSFELTSPMLFALTFSINTTGDELVSLPPLAQQAFIADGTNSNFFLSFDPLFGSGSTSVFLQPGRYEFLIQDFNANQNDGVAATRTLSSEFSYSLSAGVPEPSTWAMLIFGFGVIGWRLRSRSKVMLKLA